MGALNKAVLTFCFMTFAVAATEAALLSANEPIPPAELEAFVDGFVANSMAKHHIVGVSVAVVQDGQTILKKGYGFADIAANCRVDPDTTLFRIGSTTKTFSYIALMKRVEDGKIGLDDPVNDHLPAALQIPDEGFKEPIRIRHIFTHQAGFEDRTLSAELFVRDPKELRPQAQYLLEERPRRVREPGEFGTYSNYSVALVGAILEHVDGRPWIDIIEDEILKPLNMTHSSPREPYPPRADLPPPMNDELAENLSNGYRWGALGHQPGTFEYALQVAPAGNLSSTSADMANYMRMLLNDGTLNGVRIFGPEAARAFRTPMTHFPPAVGNMAGGFVMSNLLGRFTAYWHDGGTLLFFSNMVLIPELRLGIFVTTNTDGGASISAPLPSAIVAQFYRPLPEAPLQGSPEIVKNAAAYTGSYVGTRRQYHGLAGLVSRLQPATISITPDGYLMFAIGSVFNFSMMFAPTEDPSLFLAADNLPGALGALAFEMKDGRAVAMKTPTERWERICPVYQPAAMALAGGLVFVISLLVIGSFIARLRRQVPQTGPQRIASLAQTATAILWVVSFISLAGFLAAATNVDAIFYNWPPLSLRLFSWSALCASFLAMGTLFLLPVVWRTSSSTAGWSLGRKLRFSATGALFISLGGLLFLWGALEPWNP